MQAVMPPFWSAFSRDDLKYVQAQLFKKQIFSFSDSVHGQAMMQASVLVQVEQ